MKELGLNTRISHRAGPLPLYGHVSKLFRKTYVPTHFYFLNLHGSSFLTHILRPPLVRVIIILNLKSVRFTYDLNLALFRSVVK